MNYPRIMIAGTHSGTGKTSVALGLMAALSQRGNQVQPFKIGPDYIDPGLHFYAAGRKSHNLDGWMGTPQLVQTIFARNAADADISIVEGVMGFYDGVRGEGIKGSSAEMAMLLQIPVILVVNVRGMAQSCVSLVKGFRDYHPESGIQGVILNQATEFHKKWIKPALEEELGIPVLGCLPHEPGIQMPSRHLGLLPASENPQLTKHIRQMAAWIETGVDLDALLQIARRAPELSIESRRPAVAGEVRLGVAYDRAFNFYYQDSLDYLEELGAQLVFFSPLDDICLPPMDGLYIGGGFPEMFLPELSGNQSMGQSIREAGEKGMPIYAECGGFMYLCRQITDKEGGTWAGAGVIPARVQMTGRLQALGYVQATLRQDSILGQQGEAFKGHEFHYSILEGIDPEAGAFSLSGGRRDQPGNDGYAAGNILASYVHLHLRSQGEAARRFLQACREYAERGRPN